jgi:hypothetical protein
MDQKLISRMFAIIVLAFGVASLFLTGIDLYPTKGVHMPDVPVVISFVFVAIGLGLELRNPGTEWKLQKKMLPLAVVSLAVAIWTIFTFSILSGRYPGGSENPFDQYYADVVPVYTVFTGTFFFGFFYPIFFLFKPSTNAIVGGTIYNLMCLIIVPVATAMGFMGSPYLEDYILEVIGIVMFAYWYKNTSPDKRKFLGVNSLLFTIVACIIITVVLFSLVATGVFSVPSGVM